MKKNISRNPLWPDWYNGKKIDEVQFGRAFLEQWPLKCVNGTLYTLDGPVEDESEIKQRILENIEEYVTSGLSKKVTNILETIKLLAFSDPFPIEQDCIHLQNGVYHLPDGSFQESRLFCQNRLPVKYDPKASNPERWLSFLHELLVRVQRGHLTGQTAVSQRFSRQSDALLAQCAHFNELPLQLGQLFIKPASHYPNLPVM